MIKHKHDFVEGVKGRNKTLTCRLCKLKITKGKKTPNGAFGNPKIFRNEKERNN